jgi:hypothetical protein
MCDVRDEQGERNVNMAVVVSAMGGKPKVTDMLLDLVSLAVEGKVDEYSALLNGIEQKHRDAVEVSQHAASSHRRCLCVLVRVQQSSARLAGFAHTCVRRPCLCVVVTGACACIRVLPCHLPPTSPHTSHLTSLHLTSPRAAAHRRACCHRRCGTTSFAPSQRTSMVCVTCCVQSWS